MIYFYICNTRQQITSLCANGGTSALMKYLNNCQTVFFSKTSTATKWLSVGTPVQYINLALNMFMGGFTIL